MNFDKELFALLLESAKLVTASDPNARDYLPGEEIRKLEDLEPKLRPMVRATSIVSVPKCS